MLQLSPLLPVLIVGRLSVVDEEPLQFHLGSTTKLKLLLKQDLQKEKRKEVRSDKGKWL